MRDHWTMDTCYAEYGVDGSQCSIRVYLSEIEHYCPLIQGRTVRPENETVSSEKVSLLGLYNWSQERNRLVRELVG